MNNKARMGRWALAMTVAALMGCMGESPESLVSTAKTQLDKKDTKAAVISLKNALQKNPGLAEARFLLGKTLLEGGDLNGADIELRKAKDAGYVSEELTTLQAQLMLSRGQAAELIKQFGNSALSQPARMAELKTSLATAALSLGRKEQARGWVDEALKLDAGSARSQLLGIQILGAEQGMAPALAALETFLQSHPANAEAWVKKGQWLAADGKLPESEQAFRQALQQDKAYVPAHVGLTSLALAKRDATAAKQALDAFAAVNPNHPQLKLLQANYALDQNDTKAAQEALQPLLKMASEDGRVQYLAGVLEFQRSAWLKAESHLAKAVTAMPEARSARLLLAKTYLRLGEPAKTLSTLQSLLSPGSTQAEAFAVAAEAELALGHNDKAEKHFARAAQLNPKDGRSRTALAMTQFGKGRTEQSLHELEGISAEDTGTSADMALIAAHFRAKNFDKALAAIDVLERKQASKAIPANLRGRVELARGNRVAARKAFEAALQADPMYMPAAGSLASMDLADKQPQAALGRFEAMLKKDGAYWPAQLAIVRLKEHLGSTKDELESQLGAMVKKYPDAVPARAWLINSLMERKRYKEAATLAQEGLATSPDSMELALMLGQILSLSGDVNQSISAYSKASGLQPSSPLPYMGMAETYSRAKNASAAEQNLRKALSLKSDHLPAQTALLAIAMQNGKVDDARSIIKTVQTQRPRESVGWMLEGDLEMSQRHWAQAVSLFRKGLEKSKNPELALRMHRALLAAGNKAEAAEFAQRWRKDFPKDDTFLYYLGDVAMQAGDYPNALARYREVLALLPQHAAAMNNMAWLLNQTGQKDALKYAEKANELRPGQPAFMDTLAEILVKDGKLDQALKVQTQAVALEPNIAQHRLHLAAYLLKAGKKAEAKTELQKLQALGARFPQQAEVTKLLGESDR